MFTPAHRQTWGVTGPERAGRRKGLLTVMCKPGAVPPFCHCTLW